MLRDRSLIVTLFAAGFAVAALAQDLPAPPPAQRIETQPAPAKAEEAKAADVKPADAKPAESKPADTKPADAKPADVKPAEPKPADAKPAEPAKPADAKAADAKPGKVVDKDARNIRLQFDGISYADVIRRFAQMSGRPLLGDIKIDGTLTFFDAEPYTYDEAFDTLNLILAMKGQMLQPSDRFIRLVPLADIGQLQLKIFSGDKEPDARPGEVITMVLPVKHMDVESASKAIVPMVSTFGRIAPLARGKGILITDTYANITRIRTLLSLMDEKAEDEQKLEIKSFQLKKATASSAANMVNTLLRNAGYSRFSSSRDGGSSGGSSAPATTRGSESVLYASADDRTNLLVLRGTKDMLELATQLVTMIDAENPSAGEPVRVFGLKSAGAKDVAEVIRGLFYKREREGSSSTFYVYGDSTMNSVMVRAPLEDMPLIEKTILELDKQVTNFNSIRAFPLKATTAVAVVEVLRSVLAPRDAAGSRTVSSTAVTADPATNVIYVSGSPTILENAARLIAEIDKPLGADEAKELHLVQVKDTDPAAMATLIANTYTQRYGSKASGAILPLIQAVPGSENLLVSCSPAQWKEIQPLIEQIKGVVTGANAPVTKIVALKHAKAAELAETLKQVYAGGGRSSARRTRSSEYGGSSAPAESQVVIAASDRNNSLIIAATADEHTAIAELVKSLDVEAAQTVDPIVMIRLESADATKLAETVAAMVPRAEGKVPAVTVQADAATNSLLLRGPESERKLIEEIVAKLEKAVVQNARETRLIPVKFVSAASMVPMLTQLYVEEEGRAATGRRSETTGERVIIAAAPGDRTLVVDAPRQKIDQIAQLITSMDNKDGPAGQQIRTYTLTTGNARDLARSLSNIFAPIAQQGPPTPGAEQPPRFEADPSSNQIIVAANVAQFEAIEKVIKDVEKIVVTTTKSWRLKFARATDVVTVIESMLLDAAGPAAAAAARAGDGRTIRVAALATTNDIIVQGPPDKLALAEQLIKTFDDPNAAKDAAIQVVQLKNAQAVSLAEAVTAVINGRARAAGPEGKANEADLITISPEPNSNSVLVRGPAERVAEALKMIEKLDQQSDPASTQMKIYKLTHGDAASLAKTVEELFKSIIAQQTSLRKGVTPPPFSVAADSRTNSLVVSTTPGYFALMEELLRQIDNEAKGIEQSAQSFTLLNARAFDVASQIDTMFADRKTDKPVVQSDSMSNSVTVIAGEADMKVIAELVSSIDKAAEGRVIVVLPLKQPVKARKVAEMLKTVYPQTGDSGVVVTDQLPKGDTPVKPLPPLPPAPPDSPKENEQPKPAPKGKPAARAEDPMNVAGLALQVMEVATDSDGMTTFEVFAEAAPAAPAAAKPQPAGEKKSDVIIAVDEASNSLIISGTRQQLDAIEALMAKLVATDAEAEDADFRVYPVKHSDPEVVTQILNSLFNPRFLQQFNAQQVGGNAMQQQLFQLMQQQMLGGGRNFGFDALDPFSGALGQGDGRRNRSGDATQGGGQAGGSQGGTAQAGRNQQGRTQQQQQLQPTVAIVADKRTGRVIARGKPADLDLIGEVIKQIDTNTTLASEVRLFLLKNTDAREVSANLTEMFLGARRGTGTQARSVMIQSRLAEKIKQETGIEPADMSSILSIGANQQTNAVIVAAPGAAMQIIAEVIEEIDQAAASAAVPSVRMYPVKHADLATTVTNLRSIYAPLMGGGAGTTGGYGRVVITGDAGANTIIVSASPDQQAAIAQVIADIDKAQPGDDLIIEVYRISNVEASSVANTLNDTLNPGGQGQRINNTVQQWLRGPRGNTAAGAASATPTAPSALRITADNSSNSLVIRASKEEHAQIKTLIEKIDQSPVTAQPVQLIAMKNADAVNVAAMLTKFFAQQQGGAGNFGQARIGNFNLAAGRNPVVIEGDRDSHMLMVRADDATFAKIKDMAMQLDVASPGGELIQKIVQLQHAEAKPVADALNATFKQQPGISGVPAGLGQGAGGAAADRDPAQRVTVVAEEGSRSLIITANEENHKKVADLIARLDKTKPDTTGATIIPIKNGDAVEIAAMARDLLQQQALARIGKSGSNPAVSIVGDRRSNSVIVMADPDTASTIKFLIGNLELVSPKRGTLRVVSLKHADPAEFQRAIYSIYGGQPDQAAPQQGGGQQGGGQPNQGGQFNQGGQPGGQPGGGQFQPAGGQRPGGGQRGGQGQPFGPRSDAGNSGGGTTTTTRTTDNRVTATPLPQQKAVLINSSDADYEAIQRLAEAMDEAAKASQKVTKVVILKNANNTRLAQSLNQLFLQTANAQRLEDRVVVTALAGTQAIVVSATPEKLPQVEAVISQLDDKTVNPQVEFRIYAVKNTSPTKILPLMKQMMSKVEDIRQDSSVDVQADERTRSLIVTAKTNVFDEIGKIVSLLDVAPAHETAEVMIVQLKRADATRLAQVINTMIKPSADGQITAEARALQEQVRKLNVMDAAGKKQIELDLQKPIKITADPATPGEQGSNSVVISSTGDNLLALAALIEIMDRVPLTESVKVQLVTLKTADAESVARTLTEVFTQGQKLAGKQGTPVAGKAEPAEASGKALVNPLNVSFDLRTNTLVLSGREETLALAVQLTKDLDKEAGKFVTEVRLFPLGNAKASTLAPMLSELFAEGATTAGQGGGAAAGGNAAVEGLRTQVTRLRTILPGGKLIESDTLKSRPALTIRADDTTQTLIVAARSDVMPLIADVVKSLDIPGAGAGNAVRFLPLENADATRLKQLVDSLYTGANAKNVRESDIPTVSVDTRTNALVVAASDKTFLVLDAMIRNLDRKTPIELKEIRLVKLANAEAATLAPTLQKAMDDRVVRATSLGVKDADSLKVLVSADARSNNLIVGGSAEGFKLVESIAQQLDSAPPALTGQIQLFPLKEANAGTLATTLSQLFTQRYQSAATPDVQRQKPVILPDLRSNALLVAANADDTKVLTGLLARMDQKLVDPAVGLYVVGLKHNDSGVIGPSMQALFDARLQSMTAAGQTPAPQDKVNIQTDSLSNAIIVSASRENYALIESLLGKLDVEPPAQTGIVRMYPLQNADATRVSTLLKNLVTQGLQKPGAAATTAQQNQVVAARDKIAVEVDTRTNVLIVSASKENFAVIEEIVKQIDSGKDFGGLGDMRLYALKSADATRLAPTLQQFFDAKNAAETAANGGTPSRAMQVKVIGEARTNTLLVAGSKEAFAAVEQMIAKLDGQPVPAASEFRIFELKNATAAALQPMISNLFTAQVVRGTTKDSVTVLADARTNSLLVGAKAEDMAMVEAMIKQLDMKPRDTKETLKIFPLRKADALLVATTLRGVFEQSGTARAPGAAAGGAGAATGQAGGVSISVDERLNAIVVSAGAADLERIEALIKQLDTHTVQRITEIRVFTLQHAEATELATILNDVLTKKPIEPGGGTGAAATGAKAQTLLQVIGQTESGKEFIAQALQEGVMISADKRTNALVVSAPLDYMPLLGRLIRSLDMTSPRKADLQVYKLENADAAQMADVISQVFRLQRGTTTAGAAAGVNGSADAKAITYYFTPKKFASAGGAGTEIPAATVGTAEQDSLTVTVDSRTNSLLVGGTASHVNLVSQIISELDSSPAQARKTEVFRLRNGQAADIATALNTFLEQERQRRQTALGTDKVGAAQAIFDTEVSIVAEPASNSLLLSASPRIFPTVKAMVDKLDDPKPQVLIQVLLAEVTLDDTTDLGFEWQYRGSIGGSEVVAGTDFGIQEAINRFGGIGVSVTGGDLQMFFRALQNQGKLEVLSRPQILASDNQPANINVGQRVPFVTNSRITDTGGVVNTIEYQDVGIILNVTARIGADGFVSMDVNPEISSLSNSSVQVSEAVNAPIINNRSAGTKVSVQDGQTIVVGGLITSTDNEREQKVPILGDIPIVGHAFKNTTHRKERTELLIILTPRVLQKPEDFRAIADMERQRIEQMRKLKVQDAGKAMDIPMDGFGPLKQFENPPKIPDLPPAPASPAAPAPGDVTKQPSPVDFGRQTSKR